MDFSKDITDLLFFLAPALLVFGMAYMLIKKFLDNQYRLKLVETKLLLQKDLVPLRLQAFERLTLFMERISPNNLLGRVYQPGLSVREFHLELLSNIRSEFEHNITQQVYVSKEAWAEVRTAREEIVKIINAAAGTVAPDAKGAELNRAIFESITTLQLMPSQKAIDFLKNEMNQMY